ncbi:MAG: FtsX-like permease family protein [Chloroflexi bacterium]|nr:FtsX-like permease family protein [Chloroflexota bacterium]MBL7201131.1 FtsX-like permease family protein [Anaerolineae bacterium]
MWRPRWRKVSHDLWSNKPRTLLVVASIAVGVFAIGVIAGTYAMISGDLEASYAATNPAHLSLLTAPFDPDFVDVVRNVEGVAQAEGRRHASLQVRVGPLEWETITLVAIPDYEVQYIHRYVLKQGVGVPQDHTIVLEHKSLAKLGVEIGDVLEVELPDDVIRRMPVVGSVQDQSDVYGSILGDVQGFITYDTLEWLGQPLSLDRLYVTVTEPTGDEAHIRKVATRITDRIEKSGREVYRTSVSRGGEHPLSSIIDALLTVLIILGILVVFLSGALIANTMSALLNQHLRQIGVMKLIGATQKQIVAMYLTLIVAFGLIALLGAIPLGTWGAFEMARFVAQTINFQLQGFRVIPLAVLFQIGIAVIVPPAAGIWPVLRGSRITVQKALSSTGISSQEGRTGWIDRRLERLRALSRPSRIAVRNTFRRKGRLALTLSTLALGGAVFVAVLNTRIALNLKSEQVTRYFGADVHLDLSRDYRIDEVVREVLSVEGVEGVEVWLNTGAELVRDDGAPADSIGIIAPPADSRLIEPTVLAGRWLLPGDENAIAVNEAFWDDYPDIHIGDSVRLKVGGREDDWVVVGVFQYTGMGSLVAYANYAYLAQELNAGRQASAYRLVTAEHSLDFQEQVGAQLSAHLRSLGYKVGSVKAGESLNASTTEALGIVTSILLVMALLTALVGSIGLAGTMSMNVMERTREIGVMRAVGAYDAVVSKLVLVEGLIIGLISYVAGTVLSFPITYLLSNVVSMSIFGSPAAFAFSLQGSAIWLGVMVLLSTLASALPARNATRLTIREVLAYE